MFGTPRSAFANGDFFSGDSRLIGFNYNLLFHPKFMGSIP